MADNNYMEQLLKVLKGESTEMDMLAPKRELASLEGSASDTVSAVAPSTPAEAVQEQAQVQQIEQANTEAKSPHMQEKPSQPEEDEYQKLIKEYKETLMKKPQQAKGDEAMNWLTGIGQAANVINQAYNRPSPAVQYWGDAGMKRQEAEKAKSLADQEKLMNLVSKLKGTDKKDIYKLGDELVKVGADGKVTKLYGEKKAEPTFEEKEQKKFEIKQKLEDDKFRKDELKTTKEAISNVDEQIEKVRRTKKLLADLVKGGIVADTGPIDQYITGMSDEGQKLRQAFNDLSLTKMTKMFKGMSKAIDSDAERKMFEQSQASLSNYPSVNKAILDDLEKALESTKSKNLKYMNEDLLQAGATPLKNQQSQYSDAQERGIQRVMESNNVSRERAIKALKDAGKL